MIWNAALFCSSPLSHYSSFSLISSCCLSAIRLQGWIHKGGKRAQFVSRKYWFASSPVVMYCPFWALFLFDFLFFPLFFFFCPHLFMFARHLYITRLRNSSVLSSRHPGCTYLHKFLMCFAEAGWWGNIWEMCQEPQHTTFTLSEK